MKTAILLTLLLLGQLRGFRGTAPSAAPASQLSLAISAAFKEFVADGKYADLYKRHLGLTGVAPSVAGCGDWVPQSGISEGSALAQVLKQGTVRFGYTNRAPFHFKDKDGKSTGFEYELGNELVERIRKHYGKGRLDAVWVEARLNPAGGSVPLARAIVDAMVSGMKKGEFDVAFSGVNALPDITGTAPACPTMTRFSTVLYTGKDSLDVSKLQNTDRSTLLRFLKDHPNLTVVSTSGGMSDLTSSALIADLKAIGGSASVTTDLPLRMAQAVREKSIHFVLGDGIALSTFTLEKGFNGVDLHIDARQLAGPAVPLNMGALGPFTLRDP